MGQTASLPCNLCAGAKLGLQTRNPDPGSQRDPTTGGCMDFTAYSFSPCVSDLVRGASDSDGRLSFVLAHRYSVKAWNAQAWDHRM